MLFIYLWHLREPSPGWRAGSPVPSVPWALPGNRPGRSGGRAGDPHPGAVVSDRWKVWRQESLARRLVPAHMKQVHNTGLPAWHKHIHFILCVCIYACTPVCKFVHISIKHMCVRVCLQGSLHLQIGANAPKPLPTAAGCEYSAAEPGKKAKGIDQSNWNCTLVTEGVPKETAGSR